MSMRWSRGSARIRRRLAAISRGNCMELGCCAAGQAATDAVRRNLGARGLTGENAAMNSIARNTLLSIAGLLSICPAWGGLDEGFAAYRSEDYAKAMAEYRPLAIKGNAEAQKFLGVMYRRGQGVPMDGKQAAAWFQRAADQGDAPAQSFLGEMYENGKEGLAKDEVAAAGWYRKAAEQGMARAQNFLAAMYSDGRGGLPKDDELAVAWHRKAAEQGHVFAQFNLGVRYDTGRGVPKDYRQAASWYLKAAERGSASAQNNLGVMYREGRGVPKDDRAAVAWFRRAAEQGVANAQVSLGFMYDNGRGVEKDDQQTLIWFRKAANQGNVDGQFGLAVLYGDGRGIPTDDQQAYFWALLAAAKGSDKAREFRDVVGATLTPEQRAEAQATARTWKPVTGGSNGQHDPGRAPDASLGTDQDSNSTADATGSGFRIGGDLIVTNQHVVQDCLVSIVERDLLEAAEEVAVDLDREGLGRVRGADLQLVQARQ